jgi:hypothetical protein
MALITICPRCTSHLGLPDELGPAAQVQCPICEVEFSLATATPRELPQARLVESSTLGAEATDATPSAHERLSRLMRTSASWSSPQEQETDATEIEQSHDTAYEDADPELARSQPTGGELQLGSSRLDQLLSDLIKTPSESASSSATAGPPSPTEFEANLDGDFEPEYAAEDEHAEAEDEEILVPALSGAIDDDQLPSDLRTAPRRKRRPAGLRTLVGIVGGGALGLLLGAYGLLWLKGPAGDIAGIAQWLPPALLPASMHTIADADDAAKADEWSEPEDVTALAAAEESEASDITPTEEPTALANADQPPMLDPAVTPAAAVEPVAEETPVDSLPQPTVWPTTPIVGDLRDVKLYSVAELDDLLDAADAAHRKFLKGDLAQQESWATMGPAYMKIAGLAERYTLTDPAQFSNELITKQMAAKNVFRGTVGDPARRADLATIAARWLQHERRQNNGVLLIGRVRDIRPAGRWSEYVIDVPLGDGQVAAHVLMEKIDFSTGDEVAVAGAILPRPQEQLSGYEGDAPQVIVAGYAFTPEAFVAPKPTSAVLKPIVEGAAGE